MGLVLTESNAPGRGPNVPGGRRRAGFLPAPRASHPRVREGETPPLSATESGGAGLQGGFRHVPRDVLLKDPEGRKSSLVSNVAVGS